jgi:hypothetical protein
MHLLAVRDRNQIPPSEQNTLREKTKAALERLWRTGESCWKTQARG